MQIRHAYGVDLLLGAGTTGGGQTIGIVDAYGDPSIQSDLNNFCNYYGIPSTTVHVLGTSTVNSGWGLETALDVEWAHAIAPNATIILSVAKSASLTDLLAAVDAAVGAGASVVSMSWGAQESSGINFYDYHFQVANVTFVASSGDSGELTNTSPQVEWPASSPYVVSVGGTTLYLDSNGNRTIPAGLSSSETAWSSSGGGISSIYNSVPSFQAGWQNTGFRTVPDVSYVADPNTGVGVAYGRYLYEVGGTSAGAPEWAALVALANQSLASKLSGNPKIYSVAGTPPTINSVNFFDITSGGNGSDSDDLAVTGYDFVTGLGSPVANNLVPALAQQSPDFAMSVAPGSQSVVPGVTATYTLTIGPVAGFNEDVTLSVAGLPAGANVGYSQNPVPGASGSSVLTVTTTSGTTPVGSYNLTITGTSTTSSKTHTVSATLVVANPDYLISATPASRSVRHGRSTSYTVKVTPSGGFSETVTLSTPGLPADVTTMFSPASINTSGSSTMTVLTGLSTARQTYTLTIQGKSNTTGLTHTATVSLTVD